LIGSIPPLQGKGERKMGTYYHDIIAAIKGNRALYHVDDDDLPIEYKIEAIIQWIRARDSEKMSNN
jgi:hypothetical protein